MGLIRPPAVAGAFYPAEPTELRRMVEAFLSAVPDSDGPVPKAVIAPHAGFIYSGPIAASVYARLRPGRGTIRRVVLMGPSHRVPFRGLAVSDAAAYRSPLGDVPLDRAAIDSLRGLPEVGLLEAAHGPEHSLEVHLPFLQVVLGDFALVPIVAGQARPSVVAAVLEALWGGPETLIVISSDLSHYLDYESARAADADTCRAVEACDAAALADDQACGRVPMGGLLSLARQRHLRVETIDLRNSGDTAGPRDRVVGYGAWAFIEETGESRAHA